jgi:hypothetical protein
MRNLLSPGLHWLAISAIVLVPSSAASAGAGWSSPNFVPAPTLLVPVRDQCITIGNKRICLETEKKGNTDEEPPNGGDAGGMDGANQPGGADDTTEDADCGEGYVKLETPNKYGALCEPVGGLPTPEPVTCRADQVGVYPNCQCASGFEETNGACVAIPPPPPPPPPPVEQSKGDPRDYCSENLSDAAMEGFRAGCKSLDANNLKSTVCNAPPAVPKVWSCCCRHLK